MTALDDLRKLFGIPPEEPPSVTTGDVTKGFVDPCRCGDHVDGGTVFVGNCHGKDVYVPSDHKPKKQMTMSQTLRAVLFLRWEREVGYAPGKITQEAFYEREMLRIINREKEKL